MWKQPHPVFWITHFTRHACHSSETAVNRSVNSDRVHVNASHPANTHRETRSVSETPGLSQGKLAHCLLGLFCSYYGKDTLKNLLAKNTRVNQIIGVSIPSAHCTEDHQNCLKKSESSVQMADLRKEDQDRIKFTKGNSSKVGK